VCARQHTLSTGFVLVERHGSQIRSGYEFAPINEWDADPVELTGEQVEELARREHDRWQDERRQAAWRYGPVRDAHAKLSPYLVPWDELTEDVRNLDRDAVRLIPTVLARAAYAGIPRPGQAGPPRATQETAARKPATPAQPSDATSGTTPGPGDPAPVRDPIARRSGAGPTGPGPCPSPARWGPTCLCSRPGPRCHPTE
jgi:RyR domain